MKIDNETSQTTDPAIAVEPVLATVLDMTINVKLVNDIIEVRGSEGILLMRLDNQNSGLYIYFKCRIEQYGC